MKFRRPLAALATFAFAFGSLNALAEDICHFREAKVPPDELRILALTGVRPEWKCDYELSPLTGGKWSNTFILYAELYSGMDCVARYQLAMVVTDPTKPLKGVISIGWNEAEHQLTGVVDNGQVYSPWTDGPIAFPQFSPVGSCFFEPSEPETHRSEISGCDDFVVFPVLGIRGESSFKWNTIGIKTPADFLKACQFSHAKNALIVYLYKGPASPPVHFQNNR